MRRSVVRLFVSAGMVAIPGLTLAQDMEPMETPIEASESEVIPAEGTPSPAPAPADDGGTVLFSEEGTSPGAGVPDEYVIQPGDTLWDICARILGDPFQWPKLWSFNQYITNPHWIYPGNVLRFYEGSDIQPPRFEVTKPDEEVAMEPTEEVTPIEEETDEMEEVAFAPEDDNAGVQSKDFTERQNLRFDIKLRQEGFIAESQISPLGRVHRAEKPVRNLAEGDEIYLKFQDMSSARVGQRYTVYRQLRRVRHPVKRSSVGYLIKILGEVEIVEMDNETATAKITTSYDTIRRGDPITQYVAMIKKVNMRPNGTQLDGYIIETMADGVTLIGSRDVIYIDRGAQDGVQIGNTLNVVRKGDGLLGTTRGLPEESVGELVVVGTRANTATAVVLKATRALKLGDRVVMR